MTSFSDIMDIVAPLFIVCPRGDYRRTELGCNGRVSFLVHTSKVPGKLRLKQPWISMKVELTESEKGFGQSAPGRHWCSLVLLSPP